VSLAVAEMPKPVKRAKPVKKAPKLHPVPHSGYSPRIAPPLPESSDIAELRQAAEVAEKPLYAWQDLAGRYITAKKDGKWLYREIVLVVGRQNGKTSLLVPRIVMGLLSGEKIMHTAQDRALPREVFIEVVDIMEAKYRSLLKRKPRLANGTESIEMMNGGKYRIVAPSRSGARGPSNDLVIIDEAREMTDTDFIGAALPTLTVSRSPQTIYLSNAGTEESVVLNALRKRAESDPTLGYLEWSSDPERQRDDRTGWRQANPSLADGVNAEGHMTFLEEMYSKYVAENTPEIFDTEHRCLWVDTEMPKLLADVVWERARDVVGEPVRPSLGLAQDPQGRRISAALAWQRDGNVHAYLLADIDGHPVDLEAAAEYVKPHIRKLGVRQRILYDSWTDRDLARFFDDAKPMQGADWESACDRFVRTANSGQLRVEDPDGALTLDMANTVRRSTSHGWIAVRASEERPNTGALALIRAVWLATMPAPVGPKVY
jgi:hypothetical protein